MKKRNRLWSLLAMLVALGGIALFSACSDDSNSTTGGGPSTQSTVTVMGAAQ